jgi:hypothetical protein
MIGLTTYNIGSKLDRLEECIYGWERQTLYGRS